MVLEYSSTVVPGGATPRSRELHGLFKKNERRGSEMHTIDRYSSMRIVIDIYSFLNIDNHESRTKK